MSSGTTEQLLRIVVKEISSEQTLVLAVGTNGTILRSTDEGKTWSKLTSGTTKHLYGAHIQDASTATVVGQGGVILKTADGGSTWSSEPSGVTTDLHFHDGGVIVGAIGTVLKPQSGGGWTALSTGVSQTLYQSLAPDASASNPAVAVGGAGTLLTSADLATWAQATSGTSSTLYAVSAASPEGWLLAAGLSGTLLRSKDHGATWAALSPGGFTGTIRALSPFVSGRGYAVGSGGTILESTDNGDTWIQEASPVTDQLNAIAGVNRGEKPAYIVGNSGVILRKAIHESVCQ